MAREVSVQIKVNSSELTEELCRMISSLDGFSLIRSEVLEPGDLLILEIGKDPLEGFRSLHSVRSSRRIQEIFLITPRLDPKGVIEVRRAGADKLFFQPLQNEELKSALLQFKGRALKKSSTQEKQQAGTIVYILGCKGGVGTTTVALNLAGALAKLDKSHSVLLTDTTGLLGDLPVLLNIRPSLDWTRLIRNISRIDFNLLKEILEKHASGFFVLPSPSALDWEKMDPEVFGRILSLMGKALDFLVIDGGKSAGDVPAMILEMADTLLLITNLTHPCLENGKRLLSFFRKAWPHQEEKIKLVVNRYQKNSPISLEEAEKLLNKQIFWTIPNDFQALTEAVRLGRPLLGLGGEKAISRSFIELAAFFLKKHSPAFPPPFKLKPS